MLQIVYVKQICFSNHLCLYVELSYERSTPYEFTSLVRDLATPGDLTANKTFDFEFVNVEKPFESYFGANVLLR